MKNPSVGRAAAILAVPTLVVTLVAAKKLEGIPLVWKPTTQIGETGAVDLTSMGQARILVKPLADARENPSLIGENREKRAPRPVTTSDDVGAWCTTHLADLLSQLGLNVVKDQPDFVITGEIKRFFVTETHTYEGDIGLKIDVLDKDGAVIWSGVTGGAANRFGRSYKDENYYEVLSDSLLIAVQNLFRNDGFRTAMKRPGS